MPSKLDPYKEFITAKYQDGVTARGIHRQLTGMGFTGSYVIVRRYCQQIKG